MAVRHDFPVELPAALVAQGLTLRQERDDDIAFLTALYGSTRAAELALMAQWSDADRAAFVHQQFMAQRHHYRTAIAGVRFAVIEADGEPIGRLYVQQRESVIQLVDITLHPARRGMGLGTALIKAGLAAARERGLRVIPICPFFAAYLKKHPDEQDIVDISYLHLVRNDPLPM